MFPGTGTGLARRGVEMLPSKPLTLSFPRWKGLQTSGELMPAVCRQLGTFQRSAVCGETPECPH